MKFAVLVCLVVFISIAWARKPGPDSGCLSGIVGPDCDTYRPCKKGYTCRAGKCCAECPKGTRFGGQCYSTPGQQRCPFGYDCIFGLCCASNPVGPIRRCPIQPDGLVPVCPPHINPIPVCTVNTDCGKGKLCCTGPCGRKYCTFGVNVPRRG